MRQDLITGYDPKAGVSIATLAYEYSRAWEIPEHAHGSDQVIYSVRGVMQVFAEGRFWILPPQFAMWMPARTAHRIRILEAASMRTLYLRRGLVFRFSAGCKIIHVNPLFRELILRSVSAGSLRTDRPIDQALKTLIVSEIQTSPAVGMSVALPGDRRALRVAETLIARLSDRPCLDEVCAAVGVSIRTIQRAFQREIGVSIEVWRRQLRLIKAVELLSSGCSVKETAFRVGYVQPSALVDGFKQTFGATPKQWISEHAAGLHPPTGAPSRTGSFGARDLSDSRVASRNELACT